MDIAQIHVGSLATRVAQVAAAELAAWLQSDEDFSEPIDIWFDPGRTMPADDAAAADEVVERQNVLEAMGEYVCQRRIEVGETLYRHAVAAKLITSAGRWADLPFAQRQPWELFVSTCREVFGALKGAQLAVIDARRQALAEQNPAVLKKEDSIFEEDEGLDTLLPEAVAALRGSAAYDRAHQEELVLERQRLAHLIAARAAFNGADPAKFDHDGDGKPGGAKKSASEKAIDRQRRKPKALSVGEAPAKPPVNRGGRGRKKTR